jgi:2-iminoacetate synthase ThiH
MSVLVDRALAAQGLTPILEARKARDLDRVRALAPQLETADLLAVGALADRIRADEVGDEVRVFANTEADTGDDVVRVSFAKKATAGHAVLRRVAVARITGPFAARVRVDWSEAGLELAQVALGFGASELAGPLANRRGLPIAPDAAKKVKGEGMVAVQALKKKELASLLVMAGRRAVFAGIAADVSPDSPASPATKQESTSHV